MSSPCDEKIIFPPRTCPVPYPFCKYYFFKFPDLHLPGKKRIVILGVNRLEMLVLPVDR